MDGEAEQVFQTEEEEGRDGKDKNIDRFMKVKMLVCVWTYSVHNTYVCTVWACLIYVHLCFYVVLPWKCCCVPDNAHSCDPRIRRVREAEKAERLARKKQREDALRMEAEQRERERLEREEEERRRVELEEEDARSQVKWVECVYMVM